MVHIIDKTVHERALWAVVRIDSTPRFQKWCVYLDHTQKADFGDDPVPILILFTEAELAERYIEEELRGTGDLYPITRTMIYRELTGILRDTDVRWICFNKPPIDATEFERHRTGWITIQDFITYLRGGGKVAGRQRT